MRVLIVFLLVETCVFADSNVQRRKVPYVVDAVGNALPPPSKFPAVVGSPVNLLTPDRYEFYTFDESGELVKRLMTLEEIQDIVAAGEESEGLVTFANNNQPTIAFNFTQPSSTKVHSVVTNVQNVLREQMEAHKNQPQLHPTFDTPDVSQSWSLILPSIFGNTGVDIVPDKNAESFPTPDTDMIDVVNKVPEVNNQNQEDKIEDLSKEGDNNLSLISKITFTDEIPKSTTVTEKTSTTILNLITSSANSFTTTTTTKPLTTIKATTLKIITTPQSTNKPIKNTTPKPTKIYTTVRATANKPSVVINTSSNKVVSSTNSSTMSSTSTVKPISTTNIISTTNAVTKQPLVLSSSTPTPVALSYTIHDLKNSDINFTVTTTKHFGTLSDDKLSSSFTTSKPDLTTTEILQNKSTVKKDTTKVILGSTPIKPVTEQTLKINNSISVTPNPSVSVKISNEDANENINTLVNLTTKKISTSTPSSINTKNATQTNNFTMSITTPIIYEKVSTFLPVSSHATKEPKNPEHTTKSSITTTNAINEDIKTTTNVLTAITSSVSTTYPPIVSHEINFPSTTTESKVTITNNDISSSQSIILNENIPTKQIISLTTEETSTLAADDNTLDINPILPLFDVAQSISQIASDLGGDYPPIASTISLLDSPKPTDFNLESKESVEIDILSDIKNDSLDKFIKISTIDPHKPTDQNETAIVNSMENIKEPENKFKPNEHDIDITTLSPVKTTTVDLVLSESMGDLLSQVVNQNTQSIIISKNETQSDVISGTTQSTLEKIFNSSLMNLELGKNNSIAYTPVKISSDTNKYLTANDNITLIKPESNNTHLKIESEVNKTNDIKLNLSTIRKESEKIEPELTFYGGNHNSLLSEAYQSSNFTQFNKKINDSIIQSKIDYNIRDSSTQRNVDTDDDVIGNKETNKVEDFKKKIQKVNIDDNEFENERNNSWKIISTIAPPKAIQEIKVEVHDVSINEQKDINLEFSKENQGLEVSTKDLGEDIVQFTELCNELAFRYWNTIVEKIDKRRSFIMSPYSITSMLAMMFMGARGATSGEMNEILKLDDMVTFNPHFTLKNISDSIETSQGSGVAVSAFIRELYSDKNKGKILTFYKERAQHFYNGHVEEVNFKLISDIIRRRTNLLVKRYTWNKIQEYMKSNSITMQPPLAAFSTNIFQTDCTGTSVEGRDGEMYFVVSPNVRQRRLVPVPAVVYKKGFLAGYDPVLDATAAALGNVNSIVSVLFVMPGQQGNVVHTEDLESLERRLLDTNPTTPTWNRLLRTLLPRIGLELQIPRFSHKSIFNVSSTLKKMGLKELFDAEHADLGGLNGPSKDLYLSDMVQSSTFVTCGEGIVGDQHHTEEYPDSIDVTRRRRSLRWTNDWNEPRDYQRAFHDPHDVGDAMNLPLHLRPRQARLPARDAQVARLKFDRPFLYFVRHNPSGMILYVGRYNPRLLP